MAGIRGEEGEDGMGAELGSIDTLAGVLEYEFYLQCSITGARGEAGKPGNVAHVVAEAIAQGEAGAQGGAECEKPQEEEGGRQRRRV